MYPCFLTRDIVLEMIGCFQQIQSALGPENTIDSTSQLQIKHEVFEVKLKRQIGGFSADRVFHPEPYSCSIVLKV